ncbi:MAG: hypothetical protein CML42_07650 [Rhodobacteraceae bacterium]|nr:hypothetical protein [Paracoccaceae bacterium]|tara:strand:+ start:15196 stop:15792 length:597 start_codon:yes stop_codon:yes gene_type:complete
MKTRRKNKKSKNKTKKTYRKKDYQSGEGMLTSVWGPSLWHTLHTISFNYPVKPTKEQKKHHKNLILNLKYTMPCKYCRINLRKNLKAHPLRQCDLKDRDKFSKWVYGLHEHVNKMLGKKSGLTFCEVRDRYENFRSRCTKKEIKNKIIKIKSKKKTRKKEKGCTEPFYGKKAKLCLKIVPQENRMKTFQMDKKVIKSR